MSSYIIIQKLREVILFLQLCCVFVIGNILLRLSFAKKITVKIMDKAAGIALPENLYRNCLFTQAMMKSLWEQGTLDIRKSAVCGQKAPDPILVDPSTRQEKRLSKTGDGRKLQVLAFGSYTCPVFRLKFKELRSMAEEFHHVADFSVIYIDEAHPADGWAFKVTFAFAGTISAHSFITGVPCFRTSIILYVNSPSLQGTPFHSGGAVIYYI